ncbi:MAG: DUF6807 family protein [Microthrixaceae bacterium]
MPPSLRPSGDHPGGRVISVDAPADHPWHHGLWYTIKFVNDDNFWEEFGEFGLLVQEEPPEPGPRGSTSRLRWHRPAPGGTGSARGRWSWTRRSS